MFGINFAPHEKLPSAGQPAPSFSLPDQNGVSVSLTRFKGKWVVLYFYPKDNTPGCSIEARNFERDAAEYQAAGAVVLGVSLDSPASHQKFCGKQGLSFILLADTDGAVAELYGSLNSIFGFKHAARNTFLIDPAGTIAKTFAAVNPTRHSTQVLAAIQELNGKQPADQVAPNSV